MIGIDTNVLVRYLVNDEPRQARAARRLLESCTRDSPGRICTIVLCELVWVLTRAYSYDKETVLGVLRQLLRTAELEVEQPAVVGLALDDFETGEADFSDYLIAHLNAAAGAKHTGTLDRTAAKSPLFQLLRS